MVSLPFQSLAFCTLPLARDDTSLRFERVKREKLSPLAVRGRRWKSTHVLRIPNSRFFLRVPLRPPV